MTPADARIAALAVVQRGVFTRAQALACGCSAAQVDRHVRAGVWVRALPRVYRFAASVPGRELMQWASVLWAGPPCALSHGSAASVWAIPAPALDRPEIVVPASRAPRTPGVVVHRVARLAARDVVRAGGLPVTSPLRTIVDLAAVLETADLDAAVAAACARGLVSGRALRARLAEPGTAGRPGLARLRALAPRIGSARGVPSARMAG
jgi:Transcriptional regulator, AbiEi antitoxin